MSAAARWRPPSDVSTAWTADSAMGNTPHLCTRHTRQPRYIHTALLHPPSSVCLSPPTAAVGRMVQKRFCVQHTSPHPLGRGRIGTPHRARWRSPPWVQPPLVVLRRPPPPRRRRRGGRGRHAPTSPSHIVLGVNPTPRQRRRSDAMVTWRGGRTAWRGGTHGRAVWHRRHRRPGGGVGATRTVPSGPPRRISARQREESAHPHGAGMTWGGAVSGQRGDAETVFLLVLFPRSHPAVPLKGQTSHDWSDGRWWSVHVSVTTQQFSTVCTVHTAPPPCFRNYKSQLIPAG